MEDSLILQKVKGHLTATIMTNLIQSWDLFLPQILLGSILGAVLSVMGILIVLRKLSFFGVTLSQAVSFSVAICLFFGWNGELVPIFISSLLIFPLLTIKRSTSIREDVVLGILFVFFSSASQFLLSLGGNVQTHILASYFGDILTSQVRLNSPYLVVIIFCLVIFLSFFRRFLYISFDADQYRIQVGRSFFYDFLFFFILVATLTVAVNLLGTFYSISHLLVPVFALLPFVRSLRILAIAVTLFSVIGTWIGFFLSLVGLKIGGEVIYFPTSSTIVLVLILMAVLTLFIKKLITLKDKKFADR